MFDLSVANEDTICNKTYINNQFIIKYEYVPIICNKNNKTTIEKSVTSVVLIECKKIMDTENKLFLKWNIFIYCISKFKINNENKIELKKMNVTQIIFLKYN